MVLDKRFLYEADKCNFLHLVGILSGEKKKKSWSGTFLILKSFSVISFVSFCTFNNKNILAFYYSSLVISIKMHKLQFSILSLYCLVRF